jgi:membrane-bound serine protease (ClpP class)
MLPTVAATAGLFLFVLAVGMRALARRPMLGGASLIGQTGVAREPLAPTGQIAIQGELWRAVADGEAVDAGTTVLVTGVDGLTLKVVKTGDGGGG